MSDYNTINGTGENKKSSSEEGSVQMSSSPKTSAKDESPKAGDQKSPKKSPFKEELPKFLGKDKSPKVSVENTPEKNKSTPDKDETGEKSPKDFSDVVDKFDPDLESSESFSEEISSGILGEDTPEKDKSSQSFDEDIHVKEKSELIAKDTTLDKDKSENISDLSGGDVFEEESKNLLSPKPHLISKTSTVPAENKVAKVALESPEKRKLRLNRRGFRQQGASLDDSDVPKSEKPDKSSIVNVDASKKKIISLSSVKKTDSIPVDKDKKKIVLKRKLSLSIEEEEKNEPTKGADDPPKKKKHKPITWP